METDEGQPRRRAAGKDADPSDSPKEVCRIQGLGIQGLRTQGLGFRV